MCDDKDLRRGRMAPRELSLPPPLDSYKDDEDEDEDDDGMRMRMRMMRGGMAPRGSHGGDVDEDEEAQDFDSNNDNIRNSRGIDLK